MNNKLFTDDGKEILEIIRKRKAYEDYFFKKISSLKWFETLKERGYFNANKNPEPKMADKEGYYIIPFWSALLYLEKLSLKKRIRVSSRATRVQPTKLYLKPGEYYKVSDLLYAILLKSANDAAVVLAEAVAGSEKNFVKLMNKRAQQLGAKHTKFANSHGLPTSKSSQYTTPYDMYLIFRQALKHPFFKKAVQLQYKTIYSEKGRKIKLKSHNKILFKKWKRKIYGKTGYTKSAKSCFVGFLTKGRSTLIIAVFGCSRRWDDIKHIVSKYGGITL